jgi:Uma2 family endonuclease
MTTQPKQTRLTAEAFIEWAAAQPQGRFELSGGETVAMAPERIAHTRVKYEVMIALRNAIALGGLGCEAIGDGVSVRIDARTVYEPDALVRCGPKAPGGSTHVDDPVIVAEVVSPSSRGVDSGAKLTGYFGLPSLRHYLVVNTDARAVAHHRRGDGGEDGGEIATWILREGRLVLDPPGIAVEVADFFATL